MEARVAVFQHVERVEKHLDEETRKSIRCEEERGKSTDQLQVAMDNLQETRKAFLNALIAAVDARIESDADYQHEKRLGESMSATRSELQKAVEARDLVLYRCDQVEKQVAEQTEAVRQKIEDTLKDLLSHTVPSVKDLRA
eukprot:g19235.t1